MCQLLPAGCSANLLRRGDSGWIQHACSQPELSWLDRLQDDLGQGPCWDAHDHNTLTIVSSWSGETRWPQLTAQLPEQPDIGSVVSVPLESGGHRLLVLNVYSHRAGTFDGACLQSVELAASVLMLIIAALEQHEAIGHLRVALESNRRIGAAIGIVMSSLHCTEDEAFGMLRAVSQHAHVKLRKVADDVLYTGALFDRSGQPVSPPAPKVDRPSSTRSRLRRSA